MKTEVAFDKGLINVCCKHGAPIYYDLNIGCPICNLEGQVEGKSKVVKKGAKAVEAKPQPKPEKVEPMSFMERWQAMSTKKRILVIFAIVLIVWLALNYHAIASYFLVK